MIAAGAVVTRDVAPYVIAAGVPARPIRKRFSAEVAERLTALAWWEWDHKRLRRALPDFRALAADDFVEKHAAGNAGITSGSFAD